MPNRNLALNGVIDIKHMVHIFIVSFTIIHILIEEA